MTFIVRRKRLSSQVTQVIVIKSQFQGVLRNDKIDSLEKGKRSITLLEDKSTRVRKEHVSLYTATPM
jgi:hypothetical protein